MNPASAPLRYRHDGWTPDRQRRFVEALAECGRFSTAATRVGMTRQSVYRLQLHPGAGDFRAACDAACADHRRRADAAKLVRWRQRPKTG